MSHSYLPVLGKCKPLVQLKMVLFCIHQQVHLKSAGVVVSCYCLSREGVFGFFFLKPLSDQSIATEMSQYCCGSADWPLWINLINLATLPFRCQSSHWNVKRKSTPLVWVERHSKQGRKGFTWVNSDGWSATGSRWKESRADMEGPTGESENVSRSFIK